MSRTLIRFSIPLIGSAAVAFGVFACSSSDTPATPPAGTGGALPGAGGSTAGAAGASAGGTTPGAGGAQGGAAGSAAGAAGAATDPYTCQATPPRDPGKTAAVGAACCQTSSALGKIGKCADPGTITDPAQKAAFGHDDCVPTALCAPDPAIITQAEANGVYAKCTSAALSGLEGRCLPKCFVAGNPQAPQLKQDGCMSADLVCAPCYNPLDGTSTGACTQKAGDAPVNPAPAVYGDCGTFDGGPSGGTCVPAAIVDASGNPSAGSLKQRECPAANKCVPTLKAKDLSACFAKCTTTLAQFGAQYGAGACVPTYIVADVNPAGLAILTKGTCTEDGDLCAPCLDPLNGGVPTHSCE